VGGANIQIVHYFDHDYLEKEKSTGIFLLITQYPECSDDKLRPQILLVGTTANAGLNTHLSYYL
jgi:hypothetical protein